MVTMFIYVIVLLAWTANGVRITPQPSKLASLFATSSSGLDCMKPTSAGYLPGSADGKVELYFAYFEGPNVNDTSPIVLWLQGGPGCASTFGMLYELGPCSVVDDGDKLELKENPGYWGEYAGLLFIDQPYGTGYSVSEHHDLIPSDVEIGTATQLYTALWNFFDKFPELQERPFVVAGESYGGKFVPSITHFILQASDNRGRELKEPEPWLRHHRHFPSDVPHPNFKLAGMAVGNGLTDPIIQETVHAQVADVFGLIDEQQKDDLKDMQDELVDLIKAHKWMKAHKLRSHIISTITKAGGLGTLLDVRRLHNYDAKHAVDRFLNQDAVKEFMKAKKSGNYTSCSKEVGEVMGADAMHSVAHLVPDIVDALPCLFYQGQFDGQDGPHGNEKWLLAMEWSGAVGFSKAERTLWHMDGEVVGYEQQFDNLHHVIIRNAGHMAPHDQPDAVKSMFNRWLSQEVLPSSSAGAHDSTSQL